MKEPHPAVFSASLTTGRRLARSTVWSLAAQILPLGVAVICIPLIIAGAGVERFGVLALAWALIGYSSLFDFGLGRAITKTAAEQLGRGDGAVASTIRTGLLMTAGVGVIGAALLYALSPWLVESVLRIPADLQPESLATFQLVALAVPIVTLTAGLRGAVEAYQQFRTVAAVNVTMGTITFAGPLVALSFSTTVPAMVLALVAGRLVAGIAYAVSVAGLIEGASRQVPASGSARRLLRFGSWMTVTNVVGPVMDYMDRFIVGALLSVSAVAYYAIPFDVVTRLRTVTGALMGVLFPAFSTALIADRARAFALYVTGIRHLLLALTLPVLMLVVFAEEGLRLWLGSAFAEQSERVVQWLALGQLIHAVAAVPYALLQAAGRPDVTARLHLVELPFYLAAIWVLVSFWGIAGAAAAWTLRATADAALLLYLGGRLVGYDGARLRPVLLSAVAIVVLVAAAMLLESPGWRVSYFLAMLLLLPSIALRWLVERGEVPRLMGYLRHR